VGLQCYMTSGYFCFGGLVCLLCGYMGDHKIIVLVGCWVLAVIYFISYLSYSFLCLF